MDNGALYNETTERAVLACMLHSEICAIQGTGELEEADFYAPEHREIFASMAALSKEGKTISIATIQTAKVSYAVELICNEFYLPSQYSAYVEELAKYRQRREVVGACQAAIKTIRDNDGNYLDDLQKQLADISARNKSNVEPVGNAVMDVVINFGKQELGIPSGFEHLDMYTGGLKEGNLIIIAARPSMGKTAFATNIALNVAADPDRVVAMFSLEMSQREVLKRTICSVGLCSKDEILAKNERATKRAVEAAAKISDMKLFLDDRSSLSVGKIKARCMQIKQKMKRLDLVIVDYLQLVNMKSKKNGTREQEVAEATRGFKLLAKELNCPLILLSQLSREVERRNDRTPILSDLRESGAIEQDADIVIFLHRPHQVDKEADPRLGFAIIAKNRNGATDTVQLDWQGEYQKFSTDWTRDAERAAVVESLI